MRTAASGRGGRGEPSNERLTCGNTLANNKVYSNAVMLAIVEGRIRIGELRARQSSLIF
jgi:hypothetical protein